MEQYGTMLSWLVFQLQLPPTAGMDDAVFLQGSGSPMVSDQD